MTRLLAVGLTLALLSGCEDDLTRHIREYCDLTSRCCTRTGLPMDGERCRVTMASEVEGRVFHPEASDPCLDALRAASPAESCWGALPRVPPVCAEVFTSTGSRQPGESCQSHADCAPVGDIVFCDSGRCRVTVFVTTVAGACGVDTSANTTRACMGGLFCDADGTCRERRVEGEACTSELPCGATLYCDSAGACRPRRAVSARCETTEGCEDDAFCDSAGLCAPKRMAGEPCASDSECAPGLCSAGGCTADDLASLVCTTPRVTVR